jgi:hypothetical protein
MLNQSASRNSASLYSAAPERRGIRTILLLAGLGILFRLFLSGISYGSDDARTWYWFGKRIASDGLLKQYANQPKDSAPAVPQFNHPPIPAYWAMIAYRLTRDSAYSNRQGAAAAFPFVFRLPDILADALSCWLLLRIGSRRGGPRAVAILALAFAWSPCAILIAGHHGSTDSVYAALCLLAAYCAADLEAPFLAGLALGAAINVKLIPVLLIAPMLALYRSWRNAGRFVAGLAVMAVPFVPILIFCGRDFGRSVMAYASYRDYWGVNLFLLETAHLPQFSAEGWEMVDRYTDIGRYLVALCVIGFSLLARRRRMSFYDTAAASASLFLILTPGFGVQYMIFVLPLLFAANFKAAMRYSLLSGGFLFIAYALFWDGNIPIQTYGIAGEIRRGPGALLGLLAWTGLVAYVWQLIGKSSDLPPARNQHRKLRSK